MRTVDHPVYAGYWYCGKCHHTWPQGPGRPERNGSEEWKITAAAIKRAGGSKGPQFKSHAVGVGLLVIVMAKQGHEGFRHRVTGKLCMSTDNIRPRLKMLCRNMKAFGEVMTRLRDMGLIRKVDDQPTNHKGGHFHPHGVWEIL